MRFITIAFMGLALMVGHVQSAPKPPKVETPAQAAIRVYGAGINFASGGAETGAPVPGPSQHSPPQILSSFSAAGSVLPWNLKDELAQADKLYAQNPFHPDSLYAIWIGANDYFAGNTNPIPSATAIINAVSKMITRYGATNILVGLLPDFGLTPLQNKQPAPVRAQLTQLITAHNQIIRNGITQLLTTMKKPIRIAYLDANATLSRTIAKPRSYGFVNVVDACYDQTKNTVCCNPNQYLFWDIAHPSTRGHQYLADDAATALKAAGININQIPQWFIFGDSLSDPGNNYLTGLSFSPQQKFPDKPYWFGHYSNGITWAEQLSLKMRLIQSPIAAILNAPGVKAIATWKSGINFASGGAQSGAPVPGPKQTTDPKVLAAYQAQNSPLPWSLPDELAQADKYYTQQPFHPQALYALWIGANDYFSGNTNPQTSAAAIVSAIQHMVTKYNGRQFLVGLLPDLSTLPLNAAQPPAVKQALIQLTAAHNALVRGGMAQLQSTLLSSGITIKIAYLDANATLYRAITNPSSMGFINVKDACFNPTTGTLCDTPQQYLFFDLAHPSNTGHQQLARDAAQALKDAGIINIPQWFMFGDSLSDPGNNLIMGQSLPSPITFPPTPYYDGHYSNGPAFAECLADIINDYPGAFTNDLIPVADYLTGATKVTILAVEDVDDLVVPSESSSTSTTNVSMVVVAAVAGAAGTAVLIGIIAFLLHVRKQQSQSHLKKMSRVEVEGEMTSNPAVTMV